MDGEPDLPEEELKDQLDVALAIARKLESEIHTMEDGMEQRAATLEARRLLAERNAASQQAEADAIESTGRKHTYLIVQWWLLGSLTAWLIGLVVSMAVSPALGFIIYIPLVALSLALGYTSSNVEYKMEVADLKRARARSRDGQPLTSSDRETEEFIGQLLGHDPSAAAMASGPYSPGGDDGGGGSLLLSAVTTGASLVIASARLGVRAATWLLGSGKAKSA